MSQFLLTIAAPSLVHFGARLHRLRTALLCARHSVVHGRRATLRYHNPHSDKFIKAGKVVGESVVAVRGAHASMSRRSNDGIRLGLGPYQRIPVINPGQALLGVR